MPKSILIIEDEKSIQNILKAFLEDAGYSITLADDGLAGIAAFHKAAYDLVLLDIMMPKMDGIEVLSALRKSGCKTPLLLLTAKTQVDDRIRGLDAGADDYLPKPFDMGELLARVRAMLRRREDFHPDLLSFGDLTLNIQSGTLSCGNTDFVLPKQEYRLMEQLMINHKIFLSTEELLTRAWGYNAETDINSVWLYISYLRKRLMAMGSTVEIVSKRNIGYRLEKPL